MTPPKSKKCNPDAKASFAAPPCSAVLVRRQGWHDWQEAATLLKETRNGWRIEWKTGIHRGRTVNLTRRNWIVQPNDQAHL